jgi:hypothetical protein
MRHGSGRKINKHVTKSIFQLLIKIADGPPLKEIKALKQQKTIKKNVNATGMKKRSNSITTISPRTGMVRKTSVCSNFIA